jgi:hypothetical protein
MSCPGSWRRGSWAERAGLEPVRQPPERAGTGEPQAAGRGLLRRGPPALLLGALAELLLNGVPGQQCGDRKIRHDRPL